MLGIVSYSHKNNQNNTLWPLQKNKKKKYLLITHMYNSAAVDDFGVMIWFGI